MKMMRIVAVTVAAVAFAGASLVAQGGDPLVKATQAQFGMVKDYITKAAEQVGEDLYGFEPTPDVRSFGQLIGHVADANYMICAAAAGEKPPAGGIEKSATTKAALQKGLAESFAYCDKVFASLEGAKAAELVSFFGNQQPRLAVMAFNTAHDFEHYGNIVTYMRLKGMVPPSSQRGM
jgi:uncharacterized damage-inducible protein DinB